MNNLRTLFFAYLLFLICLSSTAKTGEGPLLDVFNLSSVEHTIIVSQKGHFPLLDTIGEELFAVFRSGAGYLGKNGAIECALRFRQGEKWHPSNTVVDTPQDDRNHALGILPSNEILVVFKKDSRYRVDGTFDDTIGSSQCMVTTSPYHGEQWTEPRPFGLSSMTNCTPYGKIVSLEDGTLALNVYGPYIQEATGMGQVREDLPHYSYLVRSRDNGKTWEDPSLIAAGHSETALLPLPDGRLLAAARASAGQRINITFSRDGGYNWYFPLRLTDSKQYPADMILLSNGWILLVYGDHREENKVIRAVLSRDQGRTWDLLYSNILLSRPARGEFGYPSVARLPSGRIAVAYYWAGYAENMYDGSNARLYCTSFNEQEFINAYQSIRAISVSP